MFEEFKKFALRGNVVDLAVGVIIGAAFNDIVKSLVDNVVMPPVGLLLAGLDFSQMKLVLKAADPVKKAAEVAVQYGLFFNTLLRFIIVAWVVFLLVKGVNAIRRRDAASPPKAPPAPTPQELLLIEIRDLLQEGRPAPAKAGPAKAAPARATPTRRPAKK